MCFAIEDYQCDDHLAAAERESRAMERTRRAGSYKGTPKPAVWRITGRFCALPGRQTPWRQQRWAPLNANLGVEFPVCLIAGIAATRFGEGSTGRTAASLAKPFTLSPGSAELRRIPNADL